MAIKSDLNNQINGLRRDFQSNPELAVLGRTSDAFSEVFVNGRPGYWWVRQMQAGGEFGPPQQVRGCTIPMQTTPGTPVRLVYEEGEKAVSGPDFIGMVTQGVNPTQSAVVDPNANNPSFVNQAYITTAYGQLVEGTLYIAIRGWLVLDSTGTWHKIETRVGPVTVPGAGDHCLAVIAIQNDATTFEIQYSTDKSTLIPLDLDDLNEAWSAMSAPTTNAPLWAFELADGQTALIEQNRWADLRQIINFLMASASGSGVDIAISGNTSGTTALISTGTAILAGGNNITLSQNGNSITISAFNQSQQTQNILRGASLSGNTSGVLALITSGTLYLAGGNNVTLSQNGNSVTFSAFSQTVQTQNLHNVTLSGNTSGALAAISSGTLTLAGGNNITLSQAGNAVTISAAAQSAQTGSIIREVNLSGNTAGTLTDITSGTLYLAGGNSITLSQNGNSVTISGPSRVTLSSYEPYPMHHTGTSVQSVNSATSGPLSLYPFNVVAPVAANHVKVVLSMSTILSSGFFTETLYWGIYTRNAGSFSLFTSNSLSWALSGSGAAFQTLSVFHATTTNDTNYSYYSGGLSATGALSQYTGLKMMELLLNTTLTEGAYWFGLLGIVSTSVQNNRWLVSLVGAANSLSALPPFGDLSSNYTNGANANLTAPYGGQWPNLNVSFSTAGLNTLPGSINLNNVTAGNDIVPFMSFASKSA